MREFQQTFHLSDGHVECDGEGPRVAGVPLLIKTNALSWSPRSKTEIESGLSGVYGVAIDATEKMRGLGVVAEALNRGELARAQIATLLLKFPDPERADPESADGLRKLTALFDAGWLAKGWDPSKHPRVGSGPNPGWFAPADGDGASPGPSAHRPGGVQVAEIKPASVSDAGAGAIVIPAGGEEPEERFPWQEREEEGGTYFNPDTGEMVTIHPGSGVFLREPWIRREDLPTQTYLRAPATETWVNPDSLERHY